MGRVDGMAMGCGCEGTGAARLLGVEASGSERASERTREGVAFFSSRLHSPHSPDPFQSPPNMNFILNIFYLDLTQAYTLEVKYMG